jgi:hypothetical protein
MSAGEKDLLARLIRCSGDSEDGRRPQESDPLHPSQEWFAAELGTTVDRIVARFKRLKEAHPCWRGCGYAHPFVRVIRIGKKAYNRYEIVKCNALLPGELKAIEPRAKRAKTGGRPPKGTVPKPPPPGQTSLLNGAGGRPSQFDKVKVTTGAVAPSPANRAPSPADAIEARRMVLVGTAYLNGWNVSDDVIAYLAGQPDELEPAARLTRIVCLASAGRQEINIGFAADVLRSSADVVARDGVVLPSDDDDATALVDVAWKVALRNEPRLSRSSARQTVENFITIVTEHAVAEGSRDRAIAELMRIFAEKRVSKATHTFRYVSSGILGGWLFTPEGAAPVDEDLRKAFDGMLPGVQQDIARHVRAHVEFDEPLSKQYLSDRGVLSKRMIAYLKRRFAPT